MSRQKLKTQNDFFAPDLQALLLAGVDEVGRGPLVGAVVTAAVILDPARPIAGLNDSKKLTAAKREQLAEQIRERALAWALGRAEPAEIDQINILQATMMAMQRAVERGVEVRVLFDHVAAMRTVGYRKTKKRLTKIGVDWHLMLPFLPFQGKYERPDLRNHRKIAVADADRLWTGGRNLADGYFQRDAGANFIDYDALAIGAALPDHLVICNRIWISQL